MKADRELTKESDPILIIGAGISGLVLALSLARFGIPSHILEAREESSEGGYGIQLSPNAVRILFDMGLEPELSRYSATPESLIIHSATQNFANSGNRQEPLSSLSLSDLSAGYGAPYLALHRTRLCKALLSAIDRFPSLIRIEYGNKVTHYQQTESGVEVSTVGGNVYNGKLLVGADGIHSRIRSQLCGKEIKKPLEPSPYLAWRAWGKKTSLPSSHFFHTPYENQRDTMHLWLANKAHLVAYAAPLKKDSSDLNLVFVTRNPIARKGMQQKLLPSTNRDLHSYYPFLQEWNPCVRTLIDSAEEWNPYPLFSGSTVEYGREQQAILIGDAAHPVLPFLAQGAAMAIEDAVTLASLLAKKGNEQPLLVRELKNLRQKRAEKIQRASQIQGWLYHLPYPISVIRDRILKIGSTVLLRRYDWIYRWRLRA